MASATEELSDSSKAVLGADVVGDYAHRFRQCLVPVLIMLLVVVLVGVATAWYGHSHYGINGVLSAFVAGLVCFLAASAALIATVLTTNTPNALSGVLAGIILRTALPFLVSILLMQAFKPLADAGLFGMVLVNYLVVLAAETLLAVRIVQANSPRVHRQ